MFNVNNQLILYHKFNKYSNKIIKLVNKLIMLHWLKNRHYYYLMIIKIHSRHLLTAAIELIRILHYLHNKIFLNILEKKLLL